MGARTAAVRETIRGMGTQRHHTIEVSERELRVILHALDIARDPSFNAAWRWWTTTRFVDQLYHRLRTHGLAA